MARLRLALATAAAAALLAAATQGRADEARVVPARSGSLGAWLVAGPLRATGQKTRLLPVDSSIADVADSAVRIESGFELARKTAFAPLAWGEPRLDLTARLKAPESECFALVGAVLRASEASKVLLVLGNDDGESVILDGQPVYTRDIGRAARSEDEAVPLSLSKGDHNLIIRLHQHTGRWEFAARLVDARDGLPPATVQVVLPGVGASQAAQLASSMLRVDLKLQVLQDRYRPVLQVTMPAGIVAGSPLPVRVVASARGKTPSVLFDVQAGEVPISQRSVHDLRIDLPAVAVSGLGDVEQSGQLEFVVEVGAQKWNLVRPVRASVRMSVARADQALTKPMPSTRDAGVLAATIRHARDRLEELVAQGDTDVQATVEEAGALSAMLDMVDAGKDPLSLVRGPWRLAYPSPLDSHDRPFGLYVPPKFDPASDKKWPLVVVLHGLNGKPMQMIRWFFGRDDPGRAGGWEDRHVGKLPPLEAFVVSPTGFGSMGYRDAAELDVMAVRDWVARSYPIDPARVYVTGPSMGGIGTAAVALRYPDSFAAAAPLCGYHSYFLRNDMAGKKLRPWERSLAEFYSNVSWADNGMQLPLLIVHGTRDLPVENSGVLIDRYKALGYPLEHEHPEEGHNVWQKTYEDFKAYYWLTRFKRDPEPKRVVLKTSSPRYADHAWVHIERWRTPLAWARVDASVKSKTSIEATTDGVDALRFDRPASRLSPGTLTVRIDKVQLDYAHGEAVAAHLQAGQWVKGPAPEAAGRKRAGLSGPIHDVYLQPLLFVYGSRDPSLTAAQRDVAEALAHPIGSDARWPVLADVELTPEQAASHALFLIGHAGSNAYVASIADRLPVHIEGSAVVVSGQKFTGTQVGSLLVYPNPLQPNQYVAVLQAPDAAGFFRALSLPRLLPDLVVYDESVASARGQLVLGGAKVLAAAVFDQSWALGPTLADPG